MSLDDAKQQGLLVWLEDDYYQTYRKTMNENALLTPDSNTDISIAYTAMHGVGADMAETLLADAGFKKWPVLRSSANLMAHSLQLTSQIQKKQGQWTWSWRSVNP